MKRKSIIILFFIPVFEIFAQQKPLITFSEIMFYPEAGNNEFIELFNLSFADSVDINHFLYKYYTSKVDTIVDAGYGTVIPPRSFAVIMEGDYEINSGLYKTLIPDSVIVLKISDSSFGTSGMSNTSGREFYLYNKYAEIVDSGFYKADNSAGFSDEKILMNGDNSQSNWANSTYLQGTPGFKNSVTPFDHNIAADSAAVFPPAVLLGNIVKISARIRNNGLLRTGAFSVNFYADTNNDSLASAGELIGRRDFPGLEVNEKLYANILYTADIPGIFKILIMVSYPDDEFSADNISSSQICVYKSEFSYNDVAVNEIMYTPSTEEPEWIELFNNTDRRINLLNWSISDNSTKVIICDSNYFINAGSYAVITGDSLNKIFSIDDVIICEKLPSLNNSGDCVIIEDSLGMLIDSVKYFPTWGGTNGRSLERISSRYSSNDSSNWGSSVSAYKATPGKINSISPKDFDIVITKVSSLPANPYFGDTVSVSVAVKNRGVYELSYSLEIYEDVNSDSVADYRLYAASGFTLSHGDSAVHLITGIVKNLSVKTGLIVKIICPQDQDTLNNSFILILIPGCFPSTILINEVMFNPSGGEPEWIEIFNNTKETVEISGWTVNDILTTPFISNIPDNTIINAGSFLILAADSAVLKYHEAIPAPVVVLNLPLLNNDEDGVVLKDGRGVIIDSMYYNKNYPLIKGNSLERISLKNSSLNLNNWGKSVDNEQSTPGRINSIAKKQHDLSVTAISTVPEKPVIGGDILITACCNNLGENDEPEFAVSFSYFRGTDADSLILLEKISGGMIKAGDSVQLITKNRIKNIDEDILISCTVEFNQDENILNNSLSDTIRPGYTAGIIKINEIMYDPESNKSEWFEIFNPSTDKKVNLKGWSVSDALPEIKKKTLCSSDYYILPGEYIVVGCDSSVINTYPNLGFKYICANFGSLGNTEDGLLIFDQENLLVDSVMYKSEWGGSSGKSMERFSSVLPSNDSSNWKSSLSELKATPGFKNSITDIKSYDRSSLVVNEIMYDPAPGNCEYIELYNAKSLTIDVGGWSIESCGKHIESFSDGFMKIPSSSYLVIASDSTVIPKYSLGGYPYLKILKNGQLDLSNNGGIISIKDGFGNTIDSICYSPGWQNRNFLSVKGIAVEKINPLLDGNIGSNWSSSVNNLGGTPGCRNSIYVNKETVDSKLTISPNPFSPDDDGFEDYTLITYQLRFNISQIRIRIFDSRGYPVRNLRDNQPSGANGTIVFNGLDDNGRPLRIGIYILIFEASDLESGDIEILKKPLVVARKLN